MHNGYCDGGKRRIKVSPHYTLRIEEFAKDMYVYKKVEARKFVRLLIRFKRADTFPLT